MESGYSYDADNDIHSFSPIYDGVIEEVVDGSVKSTLVAKTENGIRTVPILTPAEESRAFSSCATRRPRLESWRCTAWLGFWR